MAPACRAWVKQCNGMEQPLAVFTGAAGIMNEVVKSGANLSGCVGMVKELEQAQIFVGMFVGTRSAAVAEQLITKLNCRQ